MYPSQFYFPDHPLANILEADAQGGLLPLLTVPPTQPLISRRPRPAAMGEWSQFNTKSAKWVLLDL
jgi:hypothetical protein